MLSIVAVVPEPPLLVPELATGAAAETAALRAACREAANRLAAAASSWVAVGADSGGRRTVSADARGSFVGFGADVVVGLGPHAAGPVDPALPLPLLIAGWLRDGLPVTIRGELRGARHRPRRLPRARRRAGGTSDGIALLVVGDGAATHTEKAPGYLDERAGPFDDAVAAALATRTPPRSPPSTPTSPPNCGFGPCAVAGAGGRDRRRGVEGRAAALVATVRRRLPRGGVAAMRLIAVVGPTATGKSDLAMALARAYDGEIINADAMQLYRGLDIGTAKVTPAERAELPHHLLDVLDVTETASVAAFQRAARASVERVLAAGRTPVLVGGSGLYVQAVVDELEFPGTDPDLRAELEAELDRVGPAALHARLAAVDPSAAEAVLPSNGRRIVRALEVVALTGRPFAARVPEAAAPRYDAVLLGVDRPTAELDTRIARRVARMFAAGLVAETRALLPGLRDGRTASRALGYQQVLAALEHGDLEAAAADTVLATRRFVRRQRSWFRRDRRIHWLAADTPDVVDRAQAAVAASVR